MRQLAAEPLATDFAIFLMEGPRREPLQTSVLQKVLIEPRKTGW